ncbi:hypothetical protein [Ectopseudomonas mendocina]|uniref:hypothetical protein n=1 Tax=Ectopseudomonas mendocina TaxID=300 RepID=UPI00376EDEE6
MAFLKVSDDRGNEWVINSDAVLYVEPAPRGGWASGSNLFFKAGVSERMQGLTFDAQETKRVVEWLTSL